MRIYQILELERRNILVDAFSFEEEIQIEGGVFTVTVQPMQRWSAIDQPNVDGEDVHCYPFEEPTKVDILTAIGLRAEDRRRCQVWQASSSNIECCVRLRAPSQLTQPIPLTSPKVPVLALLDKLFADGYKPHSGLVRHTGTSAKIYDCRRPEAKRMYFMCVLGIEELRSNGIAEFASGQPGHYYECLLRGKNVSPGKPDKEYKKALSDTGNDTPIKLQVLSQSMQVHAPPFEDNAGDSDIVGDDVPCPTGGSGSAAAAAASSAGPCVDVVEDDSDGVVGDSDGDAPNAVAGLAAAGAGIPAFIEGMPVKILKGAISDDYKFTFDRLRVRCLNPEHKKCSKYRSTELQRNEWGDRAAEYYLGAWLMESHRPEAEHRRLKPTADMVRAYAAAHP